MWTGLNLVARKGDAVLVAGPSGCGKSALFRVVAGLWDVPNVRETARAGRVSDERACGDGDGDDGDGGDDGGDDDAKPTSEAPRDWSLSAPPHARTMFLPQRTYAPGSDATLRDLVTYPGKPSLRDDFSYVVDGVETRFDDDDDDDDDDVREALRSAGLQRLLDEASRALELERVSLSGAAPLNDPPLKRCLDVRRDWNAMLSPGERQRVAFARLALRRPSIAFLDEATSFLDERAELEMYALARRRAGCIVSVGHRSSLVRLHDTRLDFVPGRRLERLEGGDEADAFDAPGTWQMRAC